ERTTPRRSPLLPRPSERYGIGEAYVRRPGGQDLVLARLGDRARLEQPRRPPQRAGPFPEEGSPSRPPRHRARARGRPRGQGRWGQGLRQGRLGHEGGRRRDARAARRGGVGGEPLRACLRVLRAGGGALRRERPRDRLRRQPLGARRGARARARADGGGTRGRLRGDGAGRGHFQRQIRPRRPPLAGGERLDRFRRVPGRAAREAGGRDRRSRAHVLRGSDADDRAGRAGQERRPRLVQDQRELPLRPWQGPRRRREPLRGTPRGERHLRGGGFRPERARKPREPAAARAHRDGSRGASQAGLDRRGPLLGAWGRGGELRPRAALTGAPEDRVRRASAARRVLRAPRIVLRANRAL
ncbi:N-succinyl-L,L-diaminopimelate desuccinylase, partial [uncultured Rubrobacteraceae bacterium]